MTPNEAINKRLGNTPMIVRHDTIEALLEVMWGVHYQELSCGMFGGIDANGEDCEWALSEMIDGIRESGCYGCIGHDNVIHVWIGQGADPRNVLALLAHERGHAIKPHHRDDLDDEIKAEVFAGCALFAYDKMLQLLEGHIETK